jgi:uncharacterized protein with FMN-binding domain
MMLSTRSSALALSTVAFLNLSAISSAEASQWFLSQAPVVAVVPPAIYNVSQIQLAATAGRYSDGSFAGTAFDAYFGLVQVRAVVQNGMLVSVDVLDYPNHQRTSRSINRQALPLLQSEVISAQGTRVNIISGATLTSKAYLRSLKSALSRAKG